MARTRISISLAEARRIAVAAQGMHKPRPVMATAADIRRTIARLGLLQIDSVNVLVRAHYMPLFSRLGAYDPKVLEAAAGHGATRRPPPSSRRLFEYWAHEASLVPVELYPLFQWRMAAAERGEDIYSGLAAFGRERRPFIENVRAQIRDRGALAASEFDGSARSVAITKPSEAGSKQSGWWGWSDSKAALEWLFWSGGVTTAHRETAGFTRIYDLPERVLPPAVLAAPVPHRDEAQRQLLLHAISALGVATELDLRDYFRLPVADTKLRLAELVEAGALLPITVDGWQKPAFIDPSIRVPRKIETACLLSPFDPLIWFRPRSERLFDFHYRIEIYTPAHKRQFGYYCLPFRLGDRIAGRFDLKADRAAGVLRVEAAHYEPGTKPADIQGPLGDELQLMATWLGLDRVVSRPKLKL